jgi:hypothetical protein
MANQRLNSFVRFATGILALIVLSAAAAFAQSRNLHRGVAFDLSPEPVAVSAEGLRAGPDRGPRRSEGASRDQGDHDTGIKKRITVDGNTGLNWVDTGIDVSAGDLVRLAATGEVDVKSEWGIHGPEGTTKFAEQPHGYYPVESKTRYGLAARITSSKGREQQKWAYGDTREMLVKTGGRLWLTVNDDAPDGNEGEFVVNVTIILKKD